MKRKFAVFYVLITALSVAALALDVFHAFDYRVNRSASLPFLVYRIAPLDKDERIERGDSVLIDLNKFPNPVIARGVERGYVNLREPMLKRIGALPGDTVTIRDGHLFVNRDVIKITVASRDSFGGELFPYPTPVTLPPDQYWLISDPERGFDSRYFGPVSREAFTHKARPIF
jgi:conjugative transfer signal peptidase TraF